MHTCTHMHTRTHMQVAVVLTALEKREVLHKVVLEVQDQEGVLGVAHSIPITIKGEAYKIETVMKFPQVYPTCSGFSLLDALSVPHRITHISVFVINATATFCISPMCSFLSTSAHHHLYPLLYARHRTALQVWTMAPCVYATARPCPWCSRTPASTLSATPSTSRTRR